MAAEEDRGVLYKQCVHPQILDPEISLSRY